MVGDVDKSSVVVPPLPPSYRLKDLLLGEHSEDDRWVDDSRMWQAPVPFGGGWVLQFASEP